ncbi:glycosyltransferase family A protein [Colwellia sp. BRX8-9]|uniref:glycosyltransferase family A protein n=1 Tax=Colwellia sp. BRX8-9 TaxID=2759831 RepID=UPI0015F3F6B3|nr:glycosyltransferase family A protein [Colwellia sp. BRX8-9]MBA6348685.1 glycosyltransferase family 2 protein [Colwellia sp. BRX8-9]
MKQKLTFIIPIRHHESAPNWQNTIRNLEATIASINAQTENSWRCIIVANVGSELPKLPAKFEVCRVDLPPNKHHLQGDACKEDFWEAVRLDKGSRILLGLLYAQTLDYFMVVDDDDFIHRDLVKFVSCNSKENGWYFYDGYVWGDGGKFLLKHSKFYLYCGTSHIIKAKLIKLPSSLENADMNYIKDMFGSHIKIKKALDENGTPLLKLPFNGAIYRIGHSDAHSKSSGLFEHFFYKKALLKQPKELLRRFLSLRLINNNIRSKFFGH